MKTDLQIAQENTMDNIEKIARKAKIDPDYLEVYGKNKAKIDLKIMDKIADNRNGKLILVTAINPTKAGEGKSTTTIGLVDGLAQINKMVIGCLREPSLGPVFGLKGGATGGGYAQVVPMEEINLHFTGDMHAITAANNLISAVLDNHIYQGNELNIDPTKVVWKRCLDMNDRTLRSITIAQDKKTNGVERKDGFIITVATEIMAIMCLSKDLQDFEKRVSQAVVAYTYDDQPVTVGDLQVEGAVTLVMKEALKPNLVQTLEKTPVFIHGGPFANIAHGCNSLIATRMALKLSDYVVTEAGFGADLGAEKFFDIKCRYGQLKPNAVVIVATARALKLHGGVPGDQLKEENVPAILEGIKNLEKHIESIKQYRVPYIVAINKFCADTQAEVNAILQWCKENGHRVVLSDAWASGGAGAVDLAQEVVRMCEEDSKFEPLYDLDLSLEEKIETIVRKIYGGRSVIFSDRAKAQLEEFKQAGWDKLPICMAKTPNSLTDDAKIVGRPTGFDIHVQELRISAGAGFVVVLTGNIMTMPGLPKDPAALHMGINEKGISYGIF